MPEFRPQIPLLAEARRRPRRRLSTILHDLVHGLWSLLVVIVLAGAYLWTFGLPRSWATRLMSRLQAEDFRVTAGRVLLDPLEGVVFDQVRVSGPEPLGDPFLQAARLTARLRWRDAWRGRLNVNGIRVNDGAMRWPYAVAGEPPTNVTITQVHLAVDRDESGGSRIAFKGKCGDLQMFVTGALASARSSESFSPWAGLRELATRSENTPIFVGRVREEWSSARFSDPPVLRIGYHFDPVGAGNLEASFHLQGGRSYVRGVVLDEWRVLGDYSASSLTIRDLSLRGSRGTLAASGRADLATQTLEWKAEGEMAALPLMRMLPQPAGRLAQEWGLRGVGTLSVELSAGPAPWSNAWANAKGRISGSGLQVRELWIEEAQAPMAMDGTVLNIGPITARVGLGPAEGPLRASLQWDTESGAATARVETGFDPRAVQSLMTQPQMKTASLFEFTGPPPSCRFQWTRDPAAVGAWNATGEIAAVQFRFRGVPVTSFRCDFRAEPGHFDMTGWHLERPEGSVTGRLALSFDHNQYDLDMGSTIDPNALIKLIGPGFEKALAITRFQGPANVTARGRVALGERQETDLDVQIQGERLGVSWFLADAGNIGLHVTGRHYAFTNIEAAACGGKLTGTFDLYPDETEEHFRYDVDARATGMELSELAKQARPGETNAAHGRVSGALAMTGLLGEGQSSTSVGTGTIQIAKGELFKVPVFGALSTLLSGISPGMGFASQTDFKSDFRVERGRIVTREAMLEGSLISIRFEGAYFLDQRLKFVAEVKPLRDGDFAALVRWFTWPITKLFEFSLTGTLKEPVWRPNNLPKELFLIFD